MPGFEKQDLHHNTRTIPRHPDRIWFMWAGNSLRQSDPPLWSSTVFIVTPQTYLFIYGPAMLFAHWSSRILSPLPPVLWLLVPLYLPALVSFLLFSLCLYFPDAAAAAAALWKWNRTVVLPCGRVYSSPRSLWKTKTYMRYLSDVTI